MLEYRLSTDWVQTDLNLFVLRNDSQRSQLELATCKTSWKRNLLFYFLVNFIKHYVKGCLLSSSGHVMHNTNRFVYPWTGLLKAILCSYRLTQRAVCNDKYIYVSVRQPQHSVLTFLTHPPPLHPASLANNFGHIKNFHQHFPDTMRTQLTDINGFSLYPCIQNEEFWIVQFILFLFLKIPKKYRIPHAPSSSESNKMENTIIEKKKDLI